MAGGGRLRRGPRPLVDAHAHLLDPARLEYPWIDTPSPVLLALLDRYYEAARSYDVEAYERDVPRDRRTDVVACEFGAADGVAEARWVQDLATRTGTPGAFIAALDLRSHDVRERLAQYADLPVVTAVRQPLYWDADPLRRLGPRADDLRDPSWWRGFELVAASGLTWDLLVYTEQLPDALPLVRAFPDTRFVLEAACWPLDRSPDGARRWHERLLEAAALPNVVLKLQGLALLFGPSRAAVEPWVRPALDAFGPARCMFASHFPVDRLLWTFDDLLSTLRALTSDLTVDEADGFFAGCAAATYGLPSR